MSNPAKTRSTDRLLSENRQPPLIDIHSPLFIPRYAVLLLQGLLRRHRPQLHATQKVASYRSRTRAEGIARWHKFVAHHRVDLPVPFTYLNSAGAFCLTQLMKSLGINFSRVMHQKACILLTQPTPALRADEIYTLQMRVKEIIPLNKKALLVTDTSILNASGQAVRRHLDYWHIRDTPTAPTVPPHPEALEFRRLSQRPTSWQRWAPETLTFTRFHLPGNAARRYAAVSGDYTPHALRWGARLFGQPRAFMQGFGLMNLVLHHLTQALGQELAQLDIVFARPALTQQEISIYTNGQRFEVCAENGDLLAFGSLARGILQA